MLNELAKEMSSMAMDARKQRILEAIVALYSTDGEPVGSGLLASYFDIIFALNRLTHPGEKRLVSLCKSNCKILPENFEENISALLANVTKGGCYEIVCDMVKYLDKVIEQAEV